MKINCTQHCARAEQYGNIETKINVGDIFYTIDYEDIIAHRCANIIIRTTIGTAGDTHTEMQYIAKGEDTYEYYSYEIYTSFEDAEKIVFNED